MLSQERISKALVAVIRFLKSLDERYTRDAYNPNPTHLEDLTPNLDADPDNTYSGNLVWALRNPNVKNIALTGPYGSGKSSIIQTFEKKYPEYKYLNVSLASFEEEKKTDLDDRKRIEISILQQIFYKVSAKDVPFSRFRRIRNTAGWRFTSVAIFFIIYIITTAFIFKPSFFDRISWWTKFDKSHNDPILYLAAAVFIIGTVLILIRLFKTYSSARFHKLNVTSGEFELSEETDTSILNKHLDEILYFFEETDYNVLIIEDLDRFQDPEIFTKLRELNTLINSSTQIKRKVVFLYALKDDIFKENNRTKFFDFMIPVIPIISTSNSGEKLLKKFQDAEMQGDLKDTFIMDITLFIEDMRMLKNIYNEYILYKKKIGLDLNQENLLAIIVYKNFYPTDFADLNSNKGLVYDSFEHKKTTVDKFIEDNGHTIAAHLTSLKELEDELPKSIDELRSAYILAIQKKIPSANYVYLNNNEYRLAQLLTKEHFDLFKTQTNLQTSSANYNFQRSGISFKMVEQEVNATLTYDAREKSITLKINGEIDKLKARITQLEIENQQMRNWTLKQLIEKQSKDALLPAVEAEKLLSYLLRRGYIDEMYNAYISHFYEGTITRTDMDFVVSVKTYKSLGIDFQLKKIEPILKKFQLGEYGQAEILNTQLLDFLALSSTKYSKEFESLIKQIGNESVSSFKFLDNYLEKGKQIPKVIKALGKIWPGMWVFVIAQSNFTKEKKDNYFRQIVRNSDSADIEKMNQKNSLSNYINEMDDYLFQLSPGELLQKQKDLLKKLNIEFKAIRFNPDASELFDYIYTQSLYELSAGMLEFMITQKGTPGAELALEMQERNYSTILNSDCQPLINYVNTNLDVYLHNILLVLPDNTKEEETILVQLLNNESIEAQTKQAIIAKEEACYHLAEIDPLLWNYVMTENKAHPDWEDLLAYYTYEDKSTELLTTYLDQADNYELLADEPIGPTEGDKKEIVSSLSSFIILNNSLSEEAYEKLVKSIPWVYNALDFENLSAGKVDILIKARKITTTKANYDLLKDHFDGKNIRLLENNYAKYLAKKEDFIFDSRDYYLLISSKVLTPKQKADLIMEMDLSFINAALADLILRFIEENENFAISYDLFIKLLEKSTTEHLKLSLLVFYLPKLNHEQTEVALLKMGGKYVQIAGKGNRPALEKFGIHEHLAQLLKASDFISSYKLEKNKIVINTKRK